MILLPHKGACADLYGMLGGSASGTTAYSYQLGYGVSSSISRVEPLRFVKTRFNVGTEHYLTIKNIY